MYDILISQRQGFLWGRRTTKLNLIWDDNGDDEDNDSNKYSSRRAHIHEVMFEQNGMDFPHFVLPGQTLKCCKPNSYVDLTDKVHVLFNMIAFSYSVNRYWLLTMFWTLWKALRKAAGILWSVKELWSPCTYSFFVHK